jgi:hypothetical protein
MPIQFGVLVRSVAGVATLAAGRLLLDAANNGIHEVAAKDDVEDGP